MKILKPLEVSFDQILIFNSIEKQRNLCLEISWSDFGNLMKMFFAQSENTEYLDEYTKFCLAFIVYGTISYDNTSQDIKYNPDTKVIEPKNIVEFYLMQDLGNSLKLSLLSMIIANLNKAKLSEIFELVLQKCDMKEIFDILQNAYENQNFDERRFETILEFWINCLSHNDFRLNFDAEIGLDLYLKLTKLNAEFPLKLTLSQKSLIINLIIQLTINDASRETILAKQIIDDLDQLKNKKDIEFVNNILTPLLKAECKVPVCFDFVDTIKNTYLTFTKLSDEGKDSARYYNFLSRPELSEVSKHFSAHVSRSHNDHKLLISKWKLAHTINGRPNTTGYKDMLKKLTNKTCFFILVEGYCRISDNATKSNEKDTKKHGNKCTVGIFNRNGIYHKADQYKIQTSSDNF